MTSASDPTSAVAGAQARIAYARWAAELHQVRLVGAVGAALWIAFGLALHVLVFSRIGHGSSIEALLAVFAPVPFHLLMLVIASRDPLPRERVFVPVGALIFLVTGIALGFLALRSGGLTSPYHLVVMLLLLTQVLALPRPWQEGLVVALGTAVVCPLVVVIGSRWDPVVRAQLEDPAALASFHGLLVVLASAVVLRAWGGHVMWSLRRSAFETRSIGRYRLRRRIGKGGMGEVWRAHDKAIRKDVALKILSPEHGKRPASIARFEREIEATAGLDHPGIVRVHDWGVTHDGVWYYAMELLEGEDLATLVQRRGPLPAAHVARLGAQAARAVDEAHRRGVVHRDLKPSNLFVVVHDGVAGDLKVLDFGIARVDAPDGTEEGVTLTGVLVGTPGYIAPEVTTGAAATAASDVWSLGATLFFALTGTRVRDAAGKTPAQLVSDIPGALEEVILRALHREAARRPTTAAALADALDATGLALDCPPLRMNRTASDTSDDGETLTALTIPGGHEETRADKPAARDRRARPVTSG
ncbi:MAG: serine/threonine protein kinase [Deltaproteobacteria bacterium]|nr:serine/threonine protein kinase [Kofleriaceae bacterium]